MELHAPNGKSHCLAHLKKKKKKHLQAVTQEQVNAKVSIKQDTPLMFSKLGQLRRHLSYMVFAEEDSLTRFLFARDLVYFSIMCHSGSRGGDFGLVTADRCFDIPGSGGILISQLEGKVATLDNPKNCIIIPSKDNEICPVKNFRKYIKVARESNINLNEGYVFRIKERESCTIVDEQVSSSGMTERLKLHLNTLNLYEGETSHSSRRGCAITLRMLGVDDQEINKHVGWESKRMVDHYVSIGNWSAPLDLLPF